MCPALSIPNLKCYHLLSLVSITECLRIFQEGDPHCPACPGPPGRFNLIYVHKYHTSLKGKGLEVAACGPLIGDFSVAHTPHLML